jgi:hypothetical protein
MGQQRCASVDRFSTSLSLDSDIHGLANRSNAINRIRSYRRSSDESPLPSVASGFVVSSRTKVYLEPKSLNCMSPMEILIAIQIILLGTSVPKCGTSQVSMSNAQSDARRRLSSGQVDPSSRLCFVLL